VTWVGPDETNASADEGLHIQMLPPNQYYRYRMDVLRTGSTGFEAVPRAIA
jgi:hypothetical protein